MGVLRIHLDGHWDLHGLSDLFTTVEELYTIRLFLEHPSAEGIETLLRILLGTYRGSAALWMDPLRGRSARSRWAQLEGEYPFLEVRRIQYGSPGITDLVGVGRIIEQIREFIIQYMKIREDRPMRKLQEREKSLEIAEREYRLVRQFLKDAEGIRLSPDERERLTEHVKLAMERIVWYRGSGLLGSIEGGDKEGWRS